MNIGLQLAIGREILVLDKKYSNLGVKGSAKIGMNENEFNQWRGDE
jgi:hypothetical protein